MSENVMPVVNFDNVVLKQWLRDKGAVRRREALTKLREELQNLGLSRRQVHRGLLQLTTKPKVILTRHATYRRSQKSLEEYERPVDADTSCRKDTAFPGQHPSPQDEDRQTPDSTQRILEEDIDFNEKAKRIEEYNSEVSLSNKTLMSDKSCKSNEHRTMLHSFDMALKQLDKICSTKISVDKLNSRRTSVIVSTADAIKSGDKVYPINNNNSNMKSSYKDENHLTNIRQENLRVRPETSDSKSVNVDQRKKLNSKSLPDRKRSNHDKSDVHEELAPAVKNAKIQVNPASNQDKHFKQDNYENPSTDNKSTKAEGNLNKKISHEETAKFSNFWKRRKRICVSIDERKELDKRSMKNIKYKFRKWFGDCGSISEDEQEQHILQKRFKQRRKKDSVDSCDSGVCFNEGNILSSNGIEILRNIQTAVADSTMHEEISEDTSSNKTNARVDTANKCRDNVTRDKNMKVTNQVDMVTDNKHEQNDTCKVDNIIGNKDVIQKELDGVSHESNLVQSTTASDVTETSSEAKRTNINVPVSQETDVKDSMSSCSTPIIRNLSCDIDITKDLSELFGVNFNETCQITSNGNVLSIQEKIETDANQNTLNKDSVTNLQLKEQTDCNENIENNNGIPSEDTKDSCCNVKKNVKSIPVKIDLNNLFGNMNEITLPKVKLSNIVKEESNNILLTNSESNNMIEERKEATVLDSGLNKESEKETALSDPQKEDENTQSSKVPKIKLRVLSSAELGSRWCPTPVSAVISTTSELSSTNTVTMSQVSSSISIQAVPITIPIISTTRLPTGETTFPHNSKNSNIDPKFSNDANTCLENIYKFIVNTRTAQVNHTKSLFAEFEKLRQIMNTRDCISLISAVINVLNKRLLKHQPLSLPELLHYVPPFTRLYLHKPDEQNNSNRYQNIAPRIVSHTITKQNLPNNSQGSQSVTSGQRVFASFTPSPTNGTCKPVQQNLNEKVVGQQNNFVQNNVPMNSTATNCGIQQMNYRMPVQRPFMQQNGLPNAYFIRQHPVSNIHLSQGIPLQQCSPMIANTNPSGIRYNQPAPGPTANPSILYSYLSPMNTFCPVNTSNYPPQQNMNQTQGKNMKNVPCMGQQFQNTVHRQHNYNIPQGIQSQVMPQVPQNIPVINNTAQTVQNTFVPNIPQPMPRNIQKNEQVYQKIPVHVQTRVPQYFLSKQVPPGQQPQSTKKRQNTVQVSLESTEKQFHILKYLSGIQKIMLTKQINFYFGCTAWLQQQFTPEKWQIINKERSLLLHFQTLLKYFVEKTINDLTSNTSQLNTPENNTLINTANYIPKTVQIIVQENEEKRNKGIELNTEEQSKTVNTNGCNVPHQEDVTSKNQSENKQEITDNLSDKQSQSETQESEEMIQGEEIQSDKKDEETLVEQNQNAVLSILEIQKTLDNNINEKDTLKKESGSSIDMDSTNANEQILHNLPETIRDVPRAVQEEVPIISNSKVFHKQSNTNLVTVEISSNNDEVTVIDTNGISESEDEEMRLIIEEPEECEEPKKEEELNDIATSSLEDNTCETSVHSPKSLNDSEHFNDTDDTSLEESSTSYIADVRSITLEAFETIEENSDIFTSNSEENIDEKKEIKICLVCGKPGIIQCLFCDVAKYCSHECYSLHWEEHYQDCVPVKKV
nr:uncharacterized protein LOC117605134 isoform X2 [Osmia lignaria]